MTSVNGTAEANATLLFSTSASAPTSFAATATANAGGNYSIATTGLVGSTNGTTYSLYAQDVAGNLSPASLQTVVVGTANADTLANVGGSGSDLLIGGGGTDTARYAVAGNAIALTGQINSATGNVTIRTSNIDVLTGIEALNFTGIGYTGICIGNNQLRSPINQATVANSSISEFTGVYKALSGVFTFGAANPNATLVTFDANPGTATNYETVLLLGKTATSGSIGLAGGTVTLSNL